MRKAKIKKMHAKTLICLTLLSIVCALQEESNLNENEVNFLLKMHLAPREKELEEIQKELTQLTNELALKHSRRLVDGGAFDSSSAVDNKLDISANSAFKVNEKGEVLLTSQQREILDIIHKKAAIQAKKQKFAELGNEIEERKKVLRYNILHPN